MRRRAINLGPRRLFDRIYALQKSRLSRRYFGTRLPAEHSWHAASARRRRAGLDRGRSAFKRRAKIRARRGEDLPEPDEPLRSHADVPDGRAAAVRESWPNRRRSQRPNHAQKSLTGASGAALPGPWAIHKTTTLASNLSIRVFGSQYLGAAGVPPGRRRAGESQITIAQAWREA